MCTGAIAYLSGKDLQRFFLISRNFRIWSHLLKEILNGKLHFLCSAYISSINTTFWVNKVCNFSFIDTIFTMHPFERCESLNLYFHYKYHDKEICETLTNFIGFTRQAITHSRSLVFFLYPLKTSENQRGFLFSGVIEDLEWVRMT